MAQTKTKFYSYMHIQKEYSKMTKDDKISTLLEALNFMQSYNGRSRFLCIAMAMGYENFEGGENTYTKMY
jgi:hypothetical protein